MVKGSDSNPDLDEAPVREIMSITCVPYPESVPYMSNVCRTCMTAMLWLKVAGSLVSLTLPDNFANAD